MMGFHWAFGSHSARRGHPDEEVFGSVYDQRVVMRLLPYIAPFKLLTTIATVAMLIYTCTQVAVPWIIKIAIDDHILPGDFVGLRWIFGLFVTIAVVNWIMNYVQQYAMERVGQGVLYNLRRQVFGHVQKQSVSFYDKTEVGRMMSRVQGDVGQLQEFSALVVMTLGELLSLVGIVVALLLTGLEARPGHDGGPAYSDRHNGCLAAAGAKGVHRGAPHYLHSQRRAQSEHHGCPRRPGDEPSGSEPGGVRRSERPPP